MSEPLLLGIDLGTTAIKVGVFGVEGQVLAERQAPTPTVWDGPGSAHHDAEALWEAVAGLLGGLEPEHTHSLAAIGISSFGEAGTLVNPAGQATVPVLAWFDPRPKSVFGQITELMPVSAWRDRTGLLPDPNYGLCKLLWLKEHYPEAFPRARWLSVADWIAFKLTGSVQMGPTQASRTLALDLREGRWLEEPLQALGLLGVLPALRQPGQEVGKVSGEAARVTGLPPGLPLLETGHDQPLAAVGVGALGPGTWVNSCGTAEVLFAVFEGGGLEQALAASRVAIGAYALEGRFYAMASLRASGAAWDWFVRLAAGVHPVSHEQLLELAGAVPFGSEGVRFLPYLRRQSDDPAEVEPAGGVFAGLRETHHLGHLARAVLEGLSFETWRLLQSLKPAAGDPRPPIRAVGGATRNPLWMQTKADLLGADLETYRSPHAAAWGAAWLAGHHLGLVPQVRPQVQERFSPGGEDRRGLLEAYGRVLERQILAEGKG